jgi:hypothetical protein
MTRHLLPRPGILADTWTSLRSYWFHWAEARTSRRTDVQDRNDHRPGRVVSTAPTTSPAEVVGTDFGPHDVLVEMGPLQLFARVVGLTDPEHRDPAAAAAAGLPGLLVPPTYLFGLERRHPEVPRIISRLGIEIGSVLHGEQTFRYKTQTYSGDVLTFRPRFADYYEKRAGALRFLVRETTVSRGTEQVALLRNLLVAR